MERRTTPKTQISRQALAVNPEGSNARAAQISTELTRDAGAQTPFIALSAYLRRLFEF